MKSNTQETALCLNSYTQPGVECSRTQTGTSAVGQGKTSRQVSSYFLHHYPGPGEYFFPEVMVQSAQSKQTI